MEKVLSACACKGAGGAVEGTVWGWQENWLRTTGTEGQRLRGHRSGR